MASFACDILCMGYFAFFFVFRVLACMPGYAWDCLPKILWPNHHASDATKGDILQKTGILARFFFDRLDGEKERRERRERKEEKEGNKKGEEGKKRRVFKKEGKKGMRKRKKVLPGRNPGINLTWKKLGCAPWQSGNQPLSH